jgi:CoA:oxalate CoA-transferase
MKPLQGIVVLDFSQFLSGPSASLRLADLGARVIKIERPNGGDLCRQLSLHDMRLDGDSLLFHTINRNKESYAADLKNPDDLVNVKKLIEQADVLIENFRPGVMEKLGLHYETVRRINPKIVYGSITGYGKEGPWKHKPGQDLLIQSVSGLAWLNGNKEQPPVPFGLAIADMMTGAHMAQGVLACLVRRGKTGEGGLVEVSLLESILDFQFEVLTTYFNDGGKQPVRSSINNAHAYLGAPYGIYETQDGYIALAMGSVIKLGELLKCPQLSAYTEPKQWFEQRDEIKKILVEHLKMKPTEEWLNALEPADYWCSEVLPWDQMFAHEAFQTLDMLQEVARPGTQGIQTLRCPIRMNGERLKSPKWAPRLGEHNEMIEREFDLNVAGEGE